MKMKGKCRKTGDKRQSAASQKAQTACFNSKEPEAGKEGSGFATTAVKFNIM
jgi:hypothetical protein